MALKTIPGLLIQKASINTSDASVSNPGLGTEAPEIKKTTDQFAQKEANLAPATPRPSLVGRTALLSSSEPEEFLLLTPPSRREKSQNQPLAASPGSDGSTPPSPAAKAEKKPQSKFFGSASSDSSAESSPTKTPDGSDTTPKGTPSPLAAAKDVIRHSDAEFTLMKKDQVRLAKGLKCLNDLTSPEHSDQVESVRKLVVDKLGQTSPVVAIRSQKPGAQRNLTLAFAECPKLTETWIPLILGSINTFVIDRDHLTQFKGSGMHICPPDHPLESRIIDRQINRATNIWCGSITAGKENKFSSFIPRKMTETEYYSLLNEAFTNKDQCIVRSENKALFMLQHEKNSFCIEAYFREGRIVTSAFPIFHYEKYDGKMKTLKIEIENQASNPPTQSVYEVSYGDILQKVKALKKGDLPIEYDTATDQIIDLTLLLAGDPKFPACPVSRGILVHIPKSLI